MLLRSVIVAAGAVALLVPGVVLAQTYGGQADPGTGQPGAVQYQVNTSAPTWSPDGRRIAFVRGKGGNSDIYVMRADGTHRRRLTKSLSEDAFPSWSPDGKTIAFLSDRSGRTEVYVMRADGTHVRRLTRG